MTIPTPCPRCGQKLQADTLDCGGFLVQCVNEECCPDKLTIDGTGATIEEAVAAMMEMHEMTKEEA